MQNACTAADLEIGYALDESIYDCARIIDSVLCPKGRSPKNLVMETSSIELVRKNVPFAPKDGGTWFPLKYLSKHY